MMRTSIKLLLLSIILVFCKVTFFVKHRNDKITSSEIARFDIKTVKTLNSTVEVKKNEPQDVIKCEFSKMDRIRLRFQKRSEKLKQKCLYLGDNIDYIKAMKGFYYSEKYRFINCVVAKVRYENITFFSRS